MKRIKKTVMKKSTWLTLMAGAVILLAVSGYGVSKTMTPGAVSENKALYSYAVSAEGSYEVRLIPNELYPERVLDEGRLYARNLIDQLNAGFTASYMGSQVAPVSGEYSIAVIVQGYQGGSESRNVVYERSFPLTQSKSVQGEGGVQITDTVTLDLDTYREFADKADQILNAKLNREARVAFEGTFSAQTEHGDITEPFSYSMYIPLATDLFSITKGAPVSKTDAVTQIENVAAQLSPIRIMLPVLGAVIGFLILLLCLFAVRRPTPEEEYALKFKAILREYGSRMAKLSALPPIPAGARTELEDLDSLIKISDERRQPVCYSLNEAGLPIDGLLYVPDGERYYMLNLRKQIGKSASEKGEKRILIHKST